MPEKQWWEDKRKTSYEKWLDGEYPRIKDEIQYKPSTSYSPHKQPNKFWAAIWGIYKFIWRIISAILVLLLLFYTVLWIFEELF